MVYGDNTTKKIHRIYLYQLLNFVGSAPCFEHVIGHHEAVTLIHIPSTKDIVVQKQFSHNCCDHPKVHPQIYDMHAIPSNHRHIKAWQIQ